MLFRFSILVLSFLLAADAAFSREESLITHVAGNISTFGAHAGGSATPSTHLSGASSHQTAHLAGSVSSIGAHAVGSASSPARFGGASAHRSLLLASAGPHRPAPLTSLRSSFPERTGSEENPHSEGSDADTLDISTWDYLCRYRDSAGDGIFHPDTLCAPIAGIRLQTLERVPAFGRFRHHAPDTTIIRRTERNRRLYDSIAAKTSRRAVPRLLYKMLFVKPVLDTTVNGRVLDEDRLFEPYAGKTIGEIAIAREQVFAPDGNWLERAGNKIHVLTRDRVIRRDLLFRPGDKVDPQILVRNKQLLRSRAYISDAELELVPDPLDTTVINIVVHTRDSWTISADAGFHSEGRTMFSAYDANILGTGNKLSVKTHFDRNDFSYAGNIVEYEIPNVLGTFYTADFSAGRDFYNSELKLGLRKDFIKPTDYEVGASYEAVKEKNYLVDRDTSELGKVHTVDVRGGRSKYLAPIRSSIYVTGRYSRAEFSLRPPVGPEYNPAFHNTDNLLFGIGLYREKFYSANLVYGYGTREYLATGYKAELVGGYTWGEFEQMMYIGAGVKAGSFKPLGYVMGGITLGSYIDLSTGAWRRSAVDVDLRWFSNLFIFRRNRIRQFLSLNYTQGWNRYSGSEEVLRFTRENGLRTLREDVTGINRAVLNTETVFFTPYQPLGFRIAVFGFADFGLLGHHANPFRNEFFASFGIGVRIKNERLIFNAIQLELGFSVGKRGWLDSRYVRVSNQTRMEQYRYLPTRPEIVGFR